MKPSNDNGAALLTILAIVAIMSAAAITGLNALTRSTNLTRMVSERNQTLWASQSIEQAGTAILTTFMTTNDLAATKPTTITLPFPRGQIDAEFRDASNCFNLNRLASADDSTAHEQFGQLLVAADFFESEADVLRDTLADWIDSDDITRPFGAEENIYRLRDIPHRSANTMLANLSELRAVEGYSAELIERIRHLVCIRPDQQQPQLNIDTLTPDQAPLLTALFSNELNREDAESLILARPVTGWQTTEEFFAESAIATIAPDLLNSEILSTRSTMISLEATIRSGRSQETQTIVFDTSNGQTPTILSSTIGPKQ